MNYLLEQLNCEHGKVETFGGTVTFDKLQDEMKIRDRNIVTLSSFVAPENIPSEDVYNNAWHDRKNKIWYVYDDNLDERLQNQAISDPDHSQGMIGRRVWGFGSRQNHQSVLLHDLVYLGVAYIIIFSQVHRGAQHAHIFSPVLVQYQLHLV